MAFKQGEVHSADLQMQAKQHQSLAQRLIMSSHMQQALHLLQLPLLELDPFIEEQVVQNPILEIGEISQVSEFNPPQKEDEIEVEKDITISDQDLSILSKLEEDWRDHFSMDTVPVKRSSDEEKLKVYLENSTSTPISLQSHLIQQAHDTFENTEDLNHAEIIIGYIDSTGFLKTPATEICLLHNIKNEDYVRLLKEIQSFEPFGIGASTIQESLLIQLRCLGKEETLAYLIVQDHYEELLHNHLPSIQKSLKCTFQELHQAIDHDIAKLDLHPGTHFSTQPVQNIVPDVTIRQENEQLFIDVDRDRVPPLRLNHQYMSMLKDPEVPPDTKQFIKRHLFSARWLMRNLHQRYSTIERIAEVIAKKQYHFFVHPAGQLLPMTMKALAEELNLHESTIARTVANKFINSPRGLFPLRAFFTNKYTSDEGNTLSSQTVKEAIFSLIEKENKMHPLSDAKISSHLKEIGIPCARRTVAKYRLAFQIGNAQQRKKFQ
jgi:RNA polymerase sigma-54 factor